MPTNVSLQFPQIYLLLIRDWTQHTFFLWCQVRSIVTFAECRVFFGLMRTNDFARRDTKIQILDDVRFHPRQQTLWWQRQPERERERKLGHDISFLFSTNSTTIYLLIHCRLNTNKTTTTEHDDISQTASGVTQCMGPNNGGNRVPVCTICSLFVASTAVETLGW